MTKKYLTKNCQKRRDKAIFISGCDSGFGYSLAAYCRETLGMTVIAGCYGITDKGREVSGEQGASNLREKGVKVVPLDVTDDDSVEEAVVMARSILEESDTKLWQVVRVSSLNYV